MANHQWLGQLPNVLPVVINSANRHENESHNQFTVQDLRHAVRGQGHVWGMGVRRVTIPNWLYNVTSSNNTGIYTDFVTPETITITPGSYTFAELADAVEAAVLALAGGTTLVFSVNANTGYVHVTSTNASAKFVSGNLWSLMGVPTDTAIGAGLDGNRMLDLLPTHHWHICLEGTHTLLREVGARKTSLDGSLTVIPCRTGFGDMELWETETPYVVQFHEPLPLENVTISLRKDDGTLADLQGADWSFIVELYIR